MKNFKSFIQIDEILAVSPKAKGEGTFVKVSYLAQTKDPGDLEKVGPEEVGPKDTKLGQGKRKLDRLDNKQSFGEENVSEAELSPKQKEIDKNKNGKIDGFDLAAIRNKKKQPQGADFAAQRRKERLASNGRMDEDNELEEADFSKAQTTMAHTIGKEFKKKGVGDSSKGGPFAVASSMVRDRPDAAKKAYNTIKAKMSNEDHQSMLMALYDDLSEQNQDSFVELLKVDPNRLLNFARSKISNNGE
jgi:hypothetical protein